MHVAVFFIIIAIIIIIIIILIPLSTDAICVGLCNWMSI